MASFLHISRGNLWIVTNDPTQVVNQEVSATDNTEVEKKEEVQIPKRRSRSIRQISLGKVEKCK